MYGIILRLDADRQARVGKEPLRKLLGDATYDKLLAQKRELNSSLDYNNPFAPTIMRRSLYPDYFRGTDVRTLFWKIKNFDDMHDLSKIQVDQSGAVTFTFENTASTDLANRLTDLLRICNHPEFVTPKVSGKTVTYQPESATYEFSGQN